MTSGHTALTDEEVARLLSDTPLFSILGPEKINELVRSSEKHFFGPKESVFREGEMAPGFFVILEGQVQAEQRGTVLRRMGRGQFFGETTLTRGEPRSADIVAVEPTTCLKISEPRLRELMESSPRIATRLLEEMIRRNQPSAHGSRVGQQAQEDPLYLKFEFDSELAGKTFECLVDAFISDYMMKRIVADKCGWRSTTEISRDTGASLHVFYGEHGGPGSALKEPIRRGVVEARFFPGERGRGGEVMRFRVAYEKDPVKAYVSRKIRTGKKA